MFESETLLANKYDFDCEVRQNSANHGLFYGIKKLHITFEFALNSNTKL